MKNYPDDILPKDELEQTSSKQEERCEITNGAPHQRALTIKEFCKVYRIGRTSTYKEIKAGNLKPTKVRARATRILIEDAEAWVKSRPTVTSKTPVKKKAGKKPEPETDRDDDIAA